MCENHIHRKPKVSYGRFVLVGLVGPKLRPRGVSDGQLVNIPAPPVFVKLRGVQEDKLSVPIGHGASPIVGARVGKSALAISRGEGEAEGQPKAIRLNPAVEKNLVVWKRAPVPQTDTGRLG